MINTELHNGDCLEYMKKIPTSSIDLIITDPPYNLGKFMEERDTNLVKMRDNFFGAAGWDDLDYKEWKKSMNKFFHQASRVLKDGGSIIVFMAIIKVETIIQLAQKHGLYYKTTLLNEAYVLKEENCQDINEFYCCNGKKIEKKVVRETATPRSLRYKKREKIIFPYDYKNGKLIRYSTQQFNTQFPGAVSYLNDFREQLDERESDRNALWFEYGRSQALAGLNKRKLLISTVITEKVVVYMLKKKCIPYAGMYIVPKADNKTYKLEDAKEILESDEFMKYVQDVGIHISGTSLRITSKDIEEFKF